MTEFKPGWLQEQVAKSVACLEQLPPQLRQSLSGVKDEHACCYHVAAAKTVLADRERELLALKGPCSSKQCRLHYAHSGPCDTREQAS